MASSDDWRPTAQELKEEEARLAREGVVSEDDPNFKRVRDTAVVYEANYMDMELRGILARNCPELGPATMSLTEQIRRYNVARTLLRNIVPKVSIYGCITLAAGSFNFAYLYVRMSRTEPKVLYVSLGDSMVSCDGEWRGLLAPWPRVGIAMSNHADIIDRMVAAVGDVDVQMRVFYNTEVYGDMEARLVELVGANARRLMVLALFAGQFEKKHRQSRASPEYMAFLQKYGQGAKVADEEDACALYARLGTVQWADAELIRMGQKIVQLTPDEASHPLNTDFQAWREVAVSAACMDLALNLVSPNFAMMSGWFFIYETNELLFNSKRAREAVQLSATIASNPGDMRTDKVLADEAVCMLMEYAGPTFGEYMRTGRVVPGGPEMLDRYVFDVVYGALCLHSRLGQLHGDMHCDNITIGGRECEPAAVAYKAGGELYSFQHYGSYACIIDYSRTVALDDIRCVEKVVDKYATWFGEPKPNNKRLFDERAYGAIDDPELMRQMGRIWSAFDLYEFAASVARCESKGSRDISIASKVRDAARDILMSIFQDKMEVDEWAALRIIRRLWKPAKAAEIAKKVGGLAAAWSADAEMRYSARHFATLPASLSRAPMIRDRDDTPADSFGFGAVRIKARYDLEAEEEREMLRLEESQEL